MKKVYISPEMLVEGFYTEGMLAASIDVKQGTVGAEEAVAPDYDLEDDEDWGDEEEAAGGRHGAY